MLTQQWSKHVLPKGPNSGCNVSIILIFYNREPQNLHKLRIKVKSWLYLLSFSRSIPKPPIIKLWIIQAILQFKSIKSTTPHYHKCNIKESITYHIQNMSRNHTNTHLIHHKRRHPKIIATLMQRLHLIKPPGLIYNLLYNYGRNKGAPYKLGRLKLRVERRHEYFLLVLGLEKYFLFKWFLLMSGLRVGMEIIGRSNCIVFFF